MPLATHARIAGVVSLVYRFLSVCRFASIDCVEAVLMICSSAVFAVFICSAAVVGVASFLCIAVFYAHAIDLGTAALPVATAVLWVVAML